MSGGKKLLMKRVSLVVVITMLWAGTGLPASAQPSVVPSVLDGAYNEEQATLGQALYYQHCLNCHGETMGGIDKAPPLTGPQFSSIWDRAPLEALVARIQTMPPDKPGNLSRQENVEILSYLLWYNGLPIGDRPLVTEQSVLSQMLFQLPGPGQ